MIKIIERLRKYFFSKSKKMCFSPKITELRNKLLQNCSSAIDRLEKAEQRVTYFTSTHQKTTTGSPEPSVTDLPPQSSQMSGATTDNATSYEITDKDILNSFLILTHGVLIQEWEHFLYGVFAEGVIYYLSGYNLGIPKFKINFKSLKPTDKVVEMRKNISLEAKESLIGYTDLFDQSLKLFNPNVSESLKHEMQKHVQIRHIFQHNKGKIREDDIKDIGLNGPDACFSILDDNGKPHPYKEGQEIFLSKKEIQNLYDTIEKFSQAFQTQAEKAKPITK
jgi:hypothetical protein